MIYFKQEDFDKCMEFLADKPDTVETQQELYKFMHEECHKLPAYANITVKDMTVYSKVYETRNNPGHANWCSTMNDGSQVIWNKKYQEFFRLEEIGMGRCNYLTYLDTFPEIKEMLNDINDRWLLENWSNWRFQKAQRQLIAIWNGKYDENLKNYWRQ